jgi:hypothetical protein
MRRAPKLIGLLNGPIQWDDTMWAALTWDTLVNWPARTRGEAFLHESFHIVQQRLGLGMAADAREHLDAVDGRYEPNTARPSDASCAAESFIHRAPDRLGALCT